MEECRKLYYEVNDFKKLSPKGKGGCKDMFYFEIAPIVTYCEELVRVKTLKAVAEMLRPHVENEELQGLYDLLKQGGVKTH